MTWIPEELLLALGASGLEPRFEIPDIDAAEDHPLRRTLDAALAAAPAADVEEVLTNPLWLRSVQTEDGRVDLHKARLESVIAESYKALYQRRSALLRQVASRPPPYDHPALLDLVPDHDGLVPLNALGTGIGGLSRGGFVFALAIPLRQLNSSYWSMQSLLRLSDRSRLHIRLDPLQVAPAAGYRSMFYKMDVFGRGLDWQRLHNLEDEEIARWMPDNLTSADCQFTDVVWRRRGPEVHFECEEVPKCADQRPSRYFHAIYRPDGACFVHADAAVRYYSDSELASRGNQHVKDVGKVGVRVKLFRIDGTIERDDWATVLAGAFVWNNDVQRYASGQRNIADR